MTRGYQGRGNPCRRAVGPKKTGRYAAGAVNLANHSQNETSGIMTTDMTYNRRGGRRRRKDTRHARATIWRGKKMRKKGKGLMQTPGRLETKDGTPNRGPGTSQGTIDPSYKAAPA